LHFMRTVIYRVQRTKKGDANDKNLVYKLIFLSALSYAGKTSGEGF
ncbi:acetyltransferase, partial [Listeria seeligeri FSL S4-171]